MTELEKLKQLILNMLRVEPDGLPGEELTRLLPHVSASLRREALLYLSADGLISWTTVWGGRRGFKITDRKSPMSAR